MIERCTNLTKVLKNIVSLPFYRHYNKTDIWSQILKIYKTWYSTRLVQLLESKSCVLQKVGSKIAFGYYKTQLWVKSCVLKNALNTHLLLWTSSGLFSKSPCAFWGIRWGELAITKLPFKCSCLQRSHSAVIPLWVISLLCASSFTILQPKQNKHRTNTASQRTQRSSKRRIKEEEGHHPTTNPTPPLQSIFNSW